MARSFDADDYAATLIASPEFEKNCIRARHNWNLRHLKRLRPARVLEVGCGSDLLFDQATAEALDFERWTVVEPARKFADACRERTRLDPRMEVFECIGEDLPAKLGGNPPPPFDVAILSSVLQFAPDPAKLARAGLQFVKPGGHLMVNVPNANSFHRLLAVAMGLIENIYERDDYARRLQKTTTFDSASLAALLTDCGVADLELEGYLFKPFTHDQMGLILRHLPPGAAQGLEELGRAFPRNAAEIAYVGVKA